MLRSTSAFFAGERLVVVDELVDASDPVVKGREALFVSDGPSEAKPAAAKKAPAKKAAANKR